MGVTEMANTTIGVSGEATCIQPFATDAPALAELGLEVLPVKAGSKAPWTNNGYNAATNNMTMVQNWVNTKPQANIGVNCHNLLVVDIDSYKPEASHTLTWLEGELGPLPRDTVQVRTGRGGQHLWYRGHGQTRNLEGVDLKGAGGYVLVPGSVVNNNPYVWINSPFDTDIAELPQRWADYLAPNGVKCDSGLPRPRTPEERILMPASEWSQWRLDVPQRPLPSWVDRLIIEGRTGDRDRDLYAICCEAARAGWDFEAVLARLTDPANRASSKLLTKHRADPASYLARTWESALAAVQEQIDLVVSVGDRIVDLDLQRSNRRTRETDQLVLGAVIAEAIPKTIRHPAPNLEEGQMIADIRLANSFLGEKVGRCDKTVAICLKRLQADGYVVKIGQGYAVSKEDWQWSRYLVGIDLRDLSSLPHLRPPDGYVYPGWGKRGRGVVHKGQSGRFSFRTAYA